MFFFGNTGNTFSLNENILAVREILLVMMKIFLQCWKYWAGNRLPVPQAPWHLASPQIAQILTAWSNPPPSPLAPSEVFSWGVCNAANLHSTFDLANSQIFNGKHYRFAKLTFEMSCMISFHPPKYKHKFKFKYKYKYN